MCQCFYGIIGEVLTYSIDSHNMHIERSTCGGYLIVKRHGGVKGNTKYFVLLNIRNSVFSSFILRVLEVIHLITSNMQFCYLMMAALNASWWLSHWRYIWVSSAYVWYWRPCRRIVVVNGYTYIVYNRAPKTEPCGTP